MATVLLVDDDAAVLRLAAGILERAGHRVMRASNGLEGLQVYHSYAGSIDLVITDLDMPEMSGLELAARIRAAHASLKVLMMTGCPPPGFVAAYPVLCKPFGPNKLTDVVAEVLAS